MQQINQSLRPVYWVYLFIGIHLLCWTVMPILVRHNLPLDAIEGTIWGRDLQWGYDKNPFLNGWLTALAVYWGGSSGWMIYLFSQLSVAACLWVVWQLGQKILTPRYAMIAVMLLEGMQYFNFHAIDFNDNTLELGLWALTIYFFYQALRNHTRVAWIATGLFAGLGMMAKYYTAALLAAMALFLFLHRENRKTLLTASPYFGLTAFLIVVLPHTIWLFFHDFITVTYVFARTKSEPHWTNHFFYPAEFAWQQLQVVIPSCLLFTILYLGKKPLLVHEKIRVNQFDRLFIFYMALGPFLLTLLLAVIFGIKLRAGWGMPLLSLWSILLLIFIQPQLSQINVRRFIISAFSAMAALLTAYSLSLVYSSGETSANFPGKEIAEVITQRWHDRYHTPLRYVAGSRWVGGNIEFYSDDHPSVFVEWDTSRATWIDTEELKQKGAVFVWSITDNETLPDAVAAKFAQLKAPNVMTFDWQRNRQALPPIKIGVAFLPPQSD